MIRCRILLNAVRTCRVLLRACRQRTLGRLVLGVPSCWGRVLAATVSPLNGMVALLDSAITRFVALSLIVVMLSCRLMLRLVH